MQQTMVYYPRKSKYVRIAYVCLVVLAVVLVPRIRTTSADRAEYRIVDIIDGDTILVTKVGETVRVRLIGIDAPESVHPDANRNVVQGELASEYLRSLLSEISSVYVECDEEKYDSYGRLLAYVYYDEEDYFKESLNYRMVAEGYAIDKKYPPNVRYAYELESACREAREQKKGLWKTNEIG